MLRTNRYTLTVPWMPRFADSAIYNYPVILEFLGRYRKTDDYMVTRYHLNTPYRGGN